MNQKLILVISILIGALAFGLSVRYFQKRLDELEARRQAFLEQTRKVRVVAAARDIPEGVTLGIEDVGATTRYEIETELHGSVVRAEDFELLLGRKTRFKMKEGDIFYWSYIEGGERLGKGLATAVTPGMRALSISVGGAEAVSSMVAPNDRVDVLGTFTFPAKDDPEKMETVTLTVLQDVSVLATGQQLANQPQRQMRSGRSDTYSLLTLEVTPREAELLVFAEQLRGRLTLTLRNPSDASFEKELPAVDFQVIEQELPELNNYRQRHIRHKKNL